MFRPGGSEDPALNCPILKPPSETLGSLFHCFVLFLKTSLLPSHPAMFKRRGSSLCSPAFGTQWTHDCQLVSRLGRKRQKAALMQSRARLCATLWTMVRQAPLPVGSPRQEYWSRLPFPSPGDLPDPDVLTSNPRLLCLLRWQAGSLPPKHCWSVTKGCRSSLPPTLFFNFPKIVCIRVHPDEQSPRTQPN